MIYRYRCTKAGCRTRKSLKKSIDEYIRRPVCPSCGRDSLKLDNWRMKKETGPGADTCGCDGYHFPHRRGSLYCDDYRGRLTGEQLKHKYYRN